MWQKDYLIVWYDYYPTRVFYPLARARRYITHNSSYNSHIQLQTIGYPMCSFIRVVCFENIIRIFKTETEEHIEKRIFYYFDEMCDINPSANKFHILGVLS